MYVSFGENRQKLRVLNADLLKGVIFVKIGCVNTHLFCRSIFFPQLIFWKTCVLKIGFVNTQLFCRKSSNFLLLRYTNTSKKSSKSVGFFFQDWFLNYGIYQGLFPIFESFSLPFFKICIILQDTNEVQIYSTFNLKFPHIFQGQ